VFVVDDNQGFNVADSIAHSQQWISLGNVDRSRIGRKSYWEENVVPHLNESTDKLQSNAAQPTEQEQPSKWVRSAEARKALKLSTCDLAHKRDSGGIESKKVGNAYLYKIADKDAMDNTQPNNRGN
jgi:hypothetical protein